MSLLLARVRQVGDDLVPMFVGFGVLFLLGLLFGGVTGALAYRKGRSFWAWGAMAFFFAGLLPLIVLAFMPYVCRRCRRDISNSDAANGYCPYCAERYAPATNQPPLQFGCPHCQAQLSLPAAAAGRTVACGYCQQMLMAPPASAPFYG